MHTFARGVGFLNIASGILLLMAPGVARQIMHARAEYSRLSDGALRLLGVWVLLTGGVLIAATAKTEIEAVIAEVVTPERRSAA